MAFLWLKSPQQAIERVTLRVKQGGHFIADEVVRRRYRLGLHNFVAHYLPLADRFLLFDNSSEENALRLIARKNHSKPFEVLDTIVWRQLAGESHE